MSLNYKVIGKHIREVRQRNHLSQAMLSELVDKTPSYISYIESGIKSMSLDTFVLIANALGVSPDRLLMEQVTSTERCANKEIALLLSDCRDADSPGCYKIVESFLERASRQIR